MLIVVLTFSAELYFVVAFLNSVLLLIAVAETSDFFLWFVVFEVSVLTTLATLSVEGRSFRRIFALSSLILVAFIGSIGIVLALSASLKSLNSSFDVSGISARWFVVLAAFIPVLGKVPVFPLSFWLPEAHVEASWPGSVALAGYALKFSTVALITFSGVASFLRLELVPVFGILSVVFGTIAMASTNDTKKLIANFSVVHMSASVLLLVVSSSLVPWFLDFSWHHHSIITGLLFTFIGIGYATSGSRVFRLFLSSPANLPLFSTIIFVLFTFSLDLPWTANVIVELGLFSQYFANFSLLIFSSMVLILWVVVISILISTSKLKSGTPGLISSDLSVFWSGTSVVAAIVVVAIGFSTAKSHFRDITSKVTRNFCEIISDPSFMQTFQEF